MDGSDSTIITIFIVSTLIVLVLVVIIVSFVLLYQRKVLQQQMSMQNLEVKFQKELLATVLESQEVERSRIAKDLHDSVGVMLSTLQLMIKQYGNRDRQDSGRSKMVADTSEIIADTITTVRRISHNLLPPELEMLGLQAALEQLACSISRMEGLEVHTEFSEQFGRLPLKTEMRLFRIAQELLNNTLKHSGASEAAISLAEKDGRITFAYRDNGRGIPQSLIDTGAGETGGLGLNSIRSRAQSLDAKLSWNQTASAGMHLSLEFAHTTA